MASNLMPRGELESLARYQAAEFRGAMMRLGMAAMMGSEKAAQALAKASADAAVEHTLHPDRPGVADRYQATVEATALACLAEPKRTRDADLPAVGSFHG